MKIATLGPVIGTMTQDRATAVGGTLGAGPRELEVNVTLTLRRARRATLQVLRPPRPGADAALRLRRAAERAHRPTSGRPARSRSPRTGTCPSAPTAQVAIDDVFSGDERDRRRRRGRRGAGRRGGDERVPAGAARAARRRRCASSERQESTTIERVWLDTTQAEVRRDAHAAGACSATTAAARETVDVPVTMPAQAERPADAARERRADADRARTARAQARHGRRAGPALLAQLNARAATTGSTSRLIASSAGTVVGGETLPALPASVRSMLDDDKTVATRARAPRRVVGAWEQRLDRGRCAARAS